MKNRITARNSQYKDPRMNEECGMGTVHMTLLNIICGNTGGQVDPKELEAVNAENIWRSIIRK